MFTPFVYCVYIGHFSALGGRYVASITLTESQAGERNCTRQKFLTQNVMWLRLVFKIKCLVWTEVWNQYYRFQYIKN